MVRRVSISQIQSKFRQMQQKQRQEINKYNQTVRSRNLKVKQAIDKYNRDARTHNSRVRANRQRFKSEVARLNSQSSTQRFVVYRSSVSSLVEAYSHFERRVDTQNLGPRYEYALDLSEKETKNSLLVANSLLDEGFGEDQTTYDLQTSTLSNELRLISSDLGQRWEGAVFSLSPNNPDASRHFCTSAREIFTQVFEIKAPDEDVITLMPNCDRTPQGKPTRRAKIKFFLHRKGLIDDTLEDFVDQDMENIVELFRVFNEGTHGSAGKFTLHQLSTIKKRVEDGIKFLIPIIN